MNNLEEISFDFYEKGLQKGVLFSFIVRNAWMLPIHSISILDDNKIYLQKMIYLEKYKNQYFQIEVSQKQIEKVKGILKANDVVFNKDFQVENIQHCLILDGLIHTFSFYLEGENRSILGFNLDCFEKSLEQYPNETTEEVYPNFTLLMNILREIADIFGLVIDKEFFSLEE